MATRYECGILITSAKLSLPELMSLIGRPARAGSHDKDDVHVRSGTTWKTTRWREEARDLGGPLCSQILQLANDLGPKCADLVNRGAGDVVAELDVMVLCETYTLAIDLPSEVVAALAISKLALSISAYPVSPES
jgi:hypothetical protein